MGFEWQKLWKSKFILKITVSLLTLNIFSVVYLNPELSALRPLNQVLQSLNQEERLAYVQDWHQQVQGLEWVSRATMEIALFGDFDFQGNEELYDEILPLYLSGDFLRYTDNIVSELELARYVYEQLTTQAGYEAFLDELIRTSRHFSMMSIFEQTPFSQANLERTIADYENMRGRLITLDLSSGVVLFTDQLVTDLLMLMFTMVVATTLFFDEKSLGLLGLIKSTPNGRFRTALAKYFTLVGSILIMGLLLYGSNLLYFGISVGFGDLTRSLQSVFITSTARLTVGQFLAVFILLKGIAFSLIALLAAIVSQVSKHFAAVYAVIAVSLLASYGMYQNISSVSMLNAFKYLNFFGLLQVENFIGHYLNLNFFGQPVSLFLASISVLALLFLVFSISLLLSFTYVRQVEVRNLATNLFGFLKVPTHGNLLRYEAFKLLVMSKGLLFILLFAIFSYVQFANVQVHLFPDEIIYRNYMAQLSGPVTQETTAFLEGERERFEQLHQELAEISALDITEQEAGLLTSPIRRQLDFEHVFWQVWERYEYLTSTGQGYFVYDRGWERLLDKDGSQATIRLLMLSTIAVLTLSSIFAMEFKGGMNRILNSTPLGRAITVKRKVLLASLVMTALFLMMEIPRVLIIVRNFGLEQSLAPASSLPFLAGVPFNLIGAALVNLGVQYVTALLLGVFICGISLQAKKPLTALFLCTFILLVPPLLDYLGIPLFKWVSLVPLFQMNGLTVWLFSGYLVVSQLMGIVIYRQLGKRF